MKEAGNPDSNPELYEGGWEPRFEPRASMKEAGNPDSNPELYEGGWEPRFEPRAL